MYYEEGRVAIYHDLPSEKPTLQLLEYLTNDAAQNAGYSISIYRDEYKRTYTLDSNGNWLDSDGHDLNDANDDLTLYGSVVELKNGNGERASFKVCVTEVINSWEHLVSIDCLTDDGTHRNIVGNTIYANQGFGTEQSFGRELEFTIYKGHTNQLLYDFFRKSLDSTSGCYIDSTVVSFELKLFVNGTQQDYTVETVSTLGGVTKRRVISEQPCFDHPIVSQQPMRLYVVNDDNVNLDCQNRHPCKFFFGYDLS